MSPPRLIVLVGGGEHARVIADALLAAGLLGQVAGYVDDVVCTELTRRFGLRRIGTDADLAPMRGVDAILGFGGVRAVAARRAAVVRLAPIEGWAAVMHPSALLAADVQLGEGTAVLAGVIVNTGARIGAHCVLNTGAILEHDVVLGDQVQVSPGAVLGGGVRVHGGAYIGLGARVRDHVEIGADAVVGMGAVVVRDVPAGETVVGVPAR